MGTGNQLQSDGTWNYSYDAEGNETKKVNVATGETWKYGYDNKNELVSAQDWSSDPARASGAVLQKEVDYKYDVFGNKVSDSVWSAATGTTSTTNYAMDGWNGAIPNPQGNEQWNVWGTLDAGNNLQTRYLRGDAADQLFGRTDAAANAYWTLTDHLGSVRQVLDGSGAAVLSQTNYDAFGNVTYQTGSGYAGSYGFTGREADAATGLQYNRARWYDASTGRWISPDPMGFDSGDSNLYRYVNNGPMDGTDPSGKVIVADNPAIAETMQKRLSRILEGKVSVEPIPLPPRKAGEAGRVYLYVPITPIVTADILDRVHATSKTDTWTRNLLNASIRFGNDVIVTNNDLDIQYTASTVERYKLGKGGAEDLSAAEIATIQQVLMKKSGVALVNLLFDHPYPFLTQAPKAGTQRVNIELYGRNQLLPGEEVDLPQRTAFLSTDQEFVHYIIDRYNRFGPIKELYLGQHAGRVESNSDVTGVYVAPGAFLRDDSSQGRDAAASKSGMDSGSYRVLNRPFAVMKFLNQYLAADAKVVFVQCTVPGPRLEALKQELREGFRPDITVTVFNGEAQYINGEAHPRRWGPTVNAIRFANWLLSPVESPNAMKDEPFILPLGPRVVPPGSKLES